MRYLLHLHIRQGWSVYICKHAGVSRGQQVNLLSSFICKCTSNLFFHSRLWVRWATTTSSTIPDARGDSYSVAEEALPNFDPDPGCHSNLDLDEAMMMTTMLALMHDSHTFHFICIHYLHQGCFTCPVARIKCWWCFTDTHEVNVLPNKNKAKECNDVFIRRELLH